MQGCGLAVRGGSSAAAHAHWWPSRPHRQHLFLAGREISGCDLRCGPQMSRDSNGPHIAAPPTTHSRPPAQCRRCSRRLRGSAGGAPTGAPGAIFSAAIAVGAAAAARCWRGDLEGLPIGLRLRPSGLCADRAGMPLPRTGGPALGSALIHADHGPPFDAARHSRINECCITSRGLRTGSRMDRAGCAVSCG